MNSCFTAKKQKGSIDTLCKSTHVHVYFTVAEKGFSLLPSHNANCALRAMCPSLNRDCVCFAQHALLNKNCVLLPTCFTQRKLCASPNALRSMEIVCFAQHASLNTNCVLHPTQTACFAQRASLNIYMYILHIPRSFHCYYCPSLMPLLSPLSLMSLLSLQSLLSLMPLLSRIITN